MKRTPVAIALTLAFSGTALAVQQAPEAAARPSEILSPSVEVISTVESHAAIKHAFDRRGHRFLVAQSDASKPLSSAPNVSEPKLPGSDASKSQNQSQQGAGADNPQGDGGTNRNAASAGGQGGLASQSAGGKKQALNPELIMKVQKQLNAKGFDAGPVDGKWGPLTQRGLKNFQEKQSDLQASGRIDANTLAALGVELGASQTMDGSDTGTSKAKQKDEQKDKAQGQSSSDGGLPGSKNPDYSVSGRPGGDGGASTSAREGEIKSPPGDGGASTGTGSDRSPGGGAAPGTGGSSLEQDRSKQQTK